MRIDGVPPAYVPSRVTRADASTQVDAVVRQVDNKPRQQQLTNVMDTSRLEIDSARPRPAEHMQAQQYQARQALNNPAQHYQASQALASYNATAAFSSETDDAITVLGLDVYV